MSIKSSTDIKANFDTEAKTDEWLSGLSSDKARESLVKVPNKDGGMSLQAK